MPAITEPYKMKCTILVDTAETIPFTFAGIKGDADKDHRVLIIPTKRASLGRYPNSKGDYSVEGFSERIGVERKSADDIQGTVLGWETDYHKQTLNAARRERFEKELENLAKLEAGLVVVEAPLHVVLGTMQQWGDKSPDENRKIFHRSVLAYMQDFKVPWLFCSHRRHAEVATFRFLHRFWDKRREKRTRGAFGGGIDCQSREDQKPPPNQCE